jgi:hypothetical protein
MENLVTSCAACNLGKSSVPLTSIPAAIALPVDIAEKRKQLKAYTAWQKEVREYEAEQLETVVNHWERNATRLGSVRKQGLSAMINAIGSEQVIYAMDEAIRRRRPWAYACAVMHNIRDPFRRLPRYGVVCNAECRASHPNHPTTWATANTYSGALDAFVDAHPGLSICGVDTYRVAAGTTFDNNGEPCSPSKWVVPVKIENPPYIPLPEREG